MCTSRMHDSCTYFCNLYVCVMRHMMPACYTVQTVQEETCGPVVQVTVVETVLKDIPNKGHRRNYLPTKDTF